MHYRPLIFDFPNKRLLVAIIRPGEKVIEVKWMPMDDVKLEQVMP